MKSFNDYLEEIIREKKLLKEIDVRTIFLRALKDLFAKKIDEDRLAGIATQLYYVYNKPFDLDTCYSDQKLVKLLNLTAELDYYLKCGEKGSENIAGKILNDLRDYYKEHGG